MNAKKNYILQVILIIKESNYKLLYFICFFSIFLSFISSLISWNLKILIDEVSLSQSMHFIYSTISLLFIFEITSNIVSKINTYFMQKFNYSINKNVNIKILEKISRINLETLEMPNSYNLLERIKNNIASEVTNTISTFFRIISLILNLFFYSILLYKVKWFYPIISVVFSIPYFIIVTKNSFESYILETSQTKDSRRLGYLYSMLTTRNFSKEIRLYKLIDLLTKRASNIRKSLWEQKFKLLLKYSIWSVIINLLRNLSLCFCIYLTCLDIITGNSTIGNIMLVINSIRVLTTDCASLLEIISNINKNTLYFSDFKEYLNLPDEEVSMQSTLQTSDIEYKNVSFAYPNSKKLALDKINIRIESGKIIGLVGENGSGKTTFINLLMGIYKPLDGEITIGKEKLANVMKDFRDNTAFIFQNFLKYQLSVKENIAAGNFGVSPDDNYFYECMFSDFIVKLDKGSDTILAQLSNEGRELSGGEWQKLAICRALIRKNSKFLIMDEPTSALDPKVESKIYEQLKNLCYNKTTIITSHRLGVTQICDCIYVFDKGKIIEQGTHKELMKLKGKYYTMYNTQKSLYT